MESEPTAEIRDASRALRFLHIAPSWGEGGREMRAVQLMAMLGDAARHRLIALDGRYDALNQVADGVDWERAEVDLRGGVTARVRAMRGELRRATPDLVLTYNWGAIEWLLATRLERMPAVVHHEDGFGPDETERRLLRRNLARRVLFRGAHAVVVPSLRLAGIARAEWGAGRRLRYLPNGVDTARFAPVGPDGEARARCVFVCVGALRPEKYQVLAVEALARAGCRERAELLLVGDGPDRAAIAARALALGVQDRVTFVGVVRDTAPWYRRADVFVIPSRTEQMPLSLLEAMATGLPVVGADVGDVRQMVATENLPWIVPPADAVALARVMDAAAEQPSARSELGRANRRKAVSDYDKAACYGRYCDLYVALARHAAMGP